jgi:hypothetical protein
MAVLLSLTLPLPGLIWHDGLGVFAQAKPAP